MTRNLTWDASRRRRALSLWQGLVLLGLCLTTGCAALSNPALQGIPARLLPEELKAKSVEGMQPIPLNLLGQPQPDTYRVGPNDVLGLWIEGVLGERNQAPPLLPPVQLDNVTLPPAVGFPIQVQLDGTISLPLIQPLNVQGMSLAEIEKAIYRAYLEAEIFRNKKEEGKQPVLPRIIVSLARPRTFHVLVLREDAQYPQQAVVTGTTTYGSPEYIGISRKGTGWELTLPAYHNDVLTAIAKSGGLPGTDAVDAVVVERNGRRNGNWDQVIQDFKAHGIPAGAFGSGIMTIPLRIRKGMPLAVNPQDVTLFDGDVVFIPAREERLFYTGGLLPAGQHLLPRDQDLDVLEAVARVRGALFNGNYITPLFNGSVVLPGIGQPSATLLTILRKLPGGGHIPIRVDLARAVKNPSERMLLQGGDFLILQETPGQAFARFGTQMFDFTFISKYWQTGWGFGTASFSVPGGNAPSTITPISISAVAPTPAVPAIGGAATSGTSFLPIVNGSTSSTSVTSPTPGR